MLFRSTTITILGLTLTRAELSVNMTTKVKLEEAEGVATEGQETMTKAHPDRRDLSITLVVPIVATTIQEVEETEEATVEALTTTTEKATVAAITTTTTERAKDNPTSDYYDAYS